MTTVELFIGISLNRSSGWLVANVCVSLYYHEGNGEIACTSRTRYINPGITADRLVQGFGSASAQSRCDRRAPPQLHVRLIALVEDMTLFDI